MVSERMQRIWHYWGHGGTGSQDKEIMKYWNYSFCLPHFMVITWQISFCDRDVLLVNVAWGMSLICALHALNALHAAFPKYYSSDWLTWLLRHLIILLRSLECYNLVCRSKVVLLTPAKVIEPRRETIRFSLHHNPWAVSTYQNNTSYHHVYIY